jgi:hypothetical protein
MKHLMKINTLMKRNFIRTTIVLLLLNSWQANAQITAKCQDGIGYSYDPVTGQSYPTGERCANAVTSAVPFLRITPDARGGALGDIGIATSADPNGMHYNPSKLAFANKNVSIAATYTPWMRNLGLNDVYLAYLAGYVKLDSRQAVGFALRYFALGNIDFTDENGQSLGSGNPNEFDVTVAYSRKLSDKLAAGIGAKFIYSNLASGRFVEGNEIRPGIAGAADVSLTYKTPLKILPQKSDLTIGVAVSNLGSKITYTNSINRDFIPTNLGVGFAWTVQLDDYNSLTLTSDLNKLLVPTPRPELDEDGNGRADYKELSPVRGVFRSFSDAPGGFSEEIAEITKSVGLEYWYDDQFAIRTGYFYEPYSKGNRRYMTLGLGVKYSIFGLNFSYLVPTTNNRNPLDNTLRFSLIFDFAAFEGEE